MTFTRENVIHFTTQDPPPKCKRMKRNDECRPRAWGVKGRSKPLCDNRHIYL